MLQVRSHQAELIIKWLDTTNASIWLNLGGGGARYAEELAVQS